MHERLHIIFTDTYIPRQFLAAISLWTYFILDKNSKPFATYTDSNNKYFDARSVSVFLLLNVHQLQMHRIFFLQSSMACHP